MIDEKYKKKKLIFKRKETGGCQHSCVAARFFALSGTIF